MPKRTLELLEQLEALDFKDDDFSIINHNPSGNIERRREYCRERILGTGRFDPDKGYEKDRYRLEIVLAAFLGRNGHRPANPGEFRTLCQEAVRLIPYALEQGRRATAPHGPNPDGARAGTRP
jgi:hypothetical protein